ncbi:MAG TPA: thermonuclease family protein [Sedimenticola thiotaurini]|uniref:Thermonuclease family protein n=1 Tax=Sedimenticola thiotaurini TaxID=1543721 RepID=A0A831RQQ5_9GAMM|nr:thermonuclease family protein [Sedimenticola thiotaurini]
METTMTRLLPALCAALLTLSAWSAEPDHRLVRVEDGDTIVVTVDGEPRRLQLQGIDAPEDVDNPKLQRDLERTGLAPDTLLALGRAATRHLQGLVAPDDPLRLEGNLQRRDRYGRTPVVAYGRNGLSLNEQMVADGYAVMIGRYPLDPAFKERLTAEQERARSHGRGLWGERPEAMRAWSGLQP